MELNFLVGQAVLELSITTLFARFTFVSKALWYRILKKKTKQKQKQKNKNKNKKQKTRLLPNLKPLQNVPKHSLFKLCKFHEKDKWAIFC